MKIQFCNKKVFVGLLILFIINVSSALEKIAEWKGYTLIECSGDQALLSMPSNYENRFKNIFILSRKSIERNDYEIFPLDLLEYTILNIRLHKHFLYVYDAIYNQKSDLLIFDIIDPSKPLLVKKIEKFRGEMKLISDSWFLTYDNNYVLYSMNDDGTISNPSDFTFNYSWVRPIFLSDNRIISYETNNLLHLYKPGNPIVYEDTIDFRFPKLGTISCKDIMIGKFVPYKDRFIVGISMACVDPTSPVPVEPDPNRTFIPDGPLGIVYPEGNKWKFDFPIIEKSMEIGLYSQNDMITIEPFVIVSGVYNTFIITVQEKKFIIRESLERSNKIGNLNGNLLMETSSGIKLYKISDLSSSKIWREGK